MYAEISSTTLEVYTRKKKSSCTLKCCHVLGDVRGDVFFGLFCPQVYN